MLKKITHVTGTKVGLENRLKGFPCEDVCYVKEDDNLSVFVLCDGEGRSRVGRNASKIVSQFFGNYVFKSFDTMYNEKFLGSLKPTICKDIEKEIRQKAGEDHGSLTDYVTNLIAFAVNKQGQCMTFMFGEGTIICKKKEKDFYTYWCTLLSEASDYPEYRSSFSIMEAYEWKSHIRVYRWDLETDPMEQIILLTKGYNKSERGADYGIKEMSVEYLENVLNNKEDASFIWVNLM